MPGWGKPYKDGRNWAEYNEELVIRGTFLFDIDFVRQWNAELKRMNEGKRFPVPLPGIVHAVHDAVEAVP